MMSELLQEAYYYALEHQAELAGALLQHVRLVAVALGISILICVPLTQSWAAEPESSGKRASHELHPQQSRAYPRSVA